jgi:hypothetical protein
MPQNKAQKWMPETIPDIQAALPFSLSGIDNDNGLECINRSPASRYRYPPYHLHPEPVPREK